MTSVVSLALRLDRLDRLGTLPAPEHPRPGLQPVLQRVQGRNDNLALVGDIADEHFEVGVHAHPNRFELDREQGFVVQRIIADEALNLLELNRPERTVVDVEIIRYAVLRRAAALGFVRPQHGSLLQFRARCRTPALDQISPGRQGALQRAERERDHIVVVCIRDHDLDLGIRVGAVHREGHGEKVLEVIIVWVSLDPLEALQSAIPLKVSDLDRRSQCVFRIAGLLVLCHSALHPLLAAASQDQRRRRATRGGDRTTGRGKSAEVAAEARDIVRRAAGDVAGKTIAAQIRQAARHLGYQPEDWRVREAWYGRAGGWGAASLDDLRRRSVVWQERAEVAVTTTDHSTLASRIGGVRRLLMEMERQVAGLEAEVERLQRAGVTQ